MATGALATEVLGNIGLPVASLSAEPANENDADKAEVIQGTATEACDPIEEDGDGDDADWDGLLDARMQCGGSAC